MKAYVVETRKEFFDNWKEFSRNESREAVVEEIEEALKPLRDRGITIQNNNNEEWDAWNDDIYTLGFRIFVDESDIKDMDIVQLAVGMYEYRDSWSDWSPQEWSCRYCHCLYDATSIESLWTDGDAYFEQWGSGKRPKGVYVERHFKNCACITVAQPIMLGDHKPSREAAITISMAIVSARHKDACQGEYEFCPFCLNSEGEIIEDEELGDYYKESHEDYCIVLLAKKVLKSLGQVIPIIDV